METTIWGLGLGDTALTVDNKGESNGKWNGNWDYGVWGLLGYGWGPINVESLWLERDYA